MRKNKFELVVEARNAGRVLAKYMNSLVQIPATLIPDWEREYHYNEDDLVEIDGGMYVTWSRRNTQRDLVKAEALGPDQYGASWFDPILPGLSYVWEWELSDDFAKSSFGDEMIIWEVYADNAPRQTGSVRIQDIEVVSKAD